MGRLPVGVPGSIGPSLNRGLLTSVRQLQTGGWRLALTVPLQTAPALVKPARFGKPRRQSSAGAVWVWIKTETCNNTVWDSADTSRSLNQIRNVSHHGGLGLG